MPRWRRGESKFVLQGKRAHRVCDSVPSGRKNLLDAARPVHSYVARAGIGEDRIRCHAITLCHVVGGRHAPNPRIATERS
jgi:hypothetical protein